MRFSLRSRNDRFFLLTALLISTGWILTVLSWVKICTAECSEVHNYRLFGMSFEPLGLAFFSTAALFHLLSLRHTLFYRFLVLMVAGALGSELIFIGIQKYQIGQWCPICLSIAACVGGLALVFFYDFTTQIWMYKKQKNRGMLMNTLWKGIATLPVIGLGILMAFLGVAKPEQSFADGIGQQDPIFGNKNSNIEVYVITDWFCPSCQHIEPVLDQLYSRIMKKAGLIFVDRPIHRESMNYVPYNLSFMVNEKGKYFEIRKALHKLAERTKAPTSEQVQDVVKPLGVKYQQLNYSDIDSGIRFFQGIAKTFEVNSTPTVVIANRRKIHAKKLVGEKITENNILQAIEEIGSK